MIEIEHVDGGKIIFSKNESVVRFVRSIYLEIEEPDTTIPVPSTVKESLEYLKNHRECFKVISEL